MRVLIMSPQQSQSQGRGQAHSAVLVKEVHSSDEGHCARLCQAVALGHLHMVRTFIIDYKL